MSGDGRKSLYASLKMVNFCLTVILGEGYTHNSHKSWAAVQLKPSCKAVWDIEVSVKRPIVRSFLITQREGHLEWFKYRLPRKPVMGKITSQDFLYGYCYRDAM